MKNRVLKVLLIDDDLDDIRLIEEALSELEEVQFSRAWLRPCELLQADDIAEAVEILKESRADAVLVDLNLSDGSGVYAFRRIQEQSPDVPIIVLAQPEDEAQALSLLRQGAQDYLIKPELDCIPLVRAIQCSIERQRLRSAMRSFIWVDDLTGLYSDSGIGRLLEVTGAVARRLDQYLRIFLFEISDLDLIRDKYGAQESDMALILTSDILRRVFSGTDGVARISPNRFVALTLEETAPETAVDSFLAELDRANSRRANGRVLEVRVGTACGEPGVDLDTLLQSAQASLCENVRSRIGA
jgi:PleD family two-component response regulator